MTDERTPLGSGPDDEPGLSRPDPSPADDTPGTEPLNLRPVESPLADAADEPAEAAPAANRPPLAAIIAAVVLLLAVGAGLAFAVTRPGTQTAATAATAPAAGAVGTTSPADPAAPLGTAAALPTEIPLPQAIEGDLSEVIARVGDGQILRGDFVRFYQPGAAPDELLNQLIQRELVIQQGLKEGATIDQAKVDTQLAEIKQQQANDDPAQFQAFLDQSKLGTEDNLKRLLGNDQIIEQMILKHTTAEQVHARHILLSTQNISDTAAVKTEADDLLKQLQNGADFATLAKEKSADTGSAENGGDLGWALKGAYVPEFDQAVFEMQPGELRVVQTQFGYHIIEVLEPQAVRPLPNSEVLQTQAGQQAFTTTFLPWVDKLRSDAEAANQITILVPAAQLVALPDSSGDASSATPAATTTP